MQRGRAEKLELGPAEFSGVDFNIGNVPVLIQFGAGQYLGILDNSFLARFSDVEVDYMQRRSDSKPAERAQERSSGIRTAVSPPTDHRAGGDTEGADGWPFRFAD
ncbi:MAG TPA: hypothetical protein VLV78_18720 [Thermoanaerobaculia bacterium]|nr:hypothetical protein [Thermoanaerobaculia bacterium]